MMPLVDAARVLTLHSKQMEHTNTIDRFLKLAELEPANAELYIAAAESYETLIRHRAEHGLKSGTSGRYINPEYLSKLERLHLRNCFKPIRELQDLLNTRFRLAFLL